MNVAYLESAPFGPMQTYTFVPSFNMQAGDGVATLKARTLLAYYAEKRELQVQEYTAGNMVRWCIHYGPDVTDEQIETFKETIPQVFQPTIGTIDAVIAVDYTAPPAGQPAIIAVRNDPVVNGIFHNGFINSSVRWLHKRPHELEALTEALASSKLKSE